MKNTNRLNEVHFKFYLWIYSLIAFIIFILTSFVKADEYSDLREIGFQKEKIDSIYIELLSAYDSILLVEDIITKLEENTINKKEAMTQGMQIIKDTKQKIMEAENKLNTLEPLVLSTAVMKHMESLYSEIQAFIRNDVKPTIDEVVLTTEEALSNALKGNFDSYTSRWSETLRKTIILIEGENQFLKLAIGTLDKNHPNVGINQSIIESNNFAVSLVSTLMFILNNPEADDNAMLEYFSRLEMSLEKNIEKNESFLGKSELAILNVEAEFANTELSEADKDIYSRMINIFKESLAIEREVLRSMKNNAKTFTYENFRDSDDLLNQLLSGFDEMSYYTTLRDNVELKASKLLQDF